MKRIRTGFTILEVVVALAIISLVAISAMATVAQQLRVSAHARETERASALATEKLISLPLLGAQNIQTLPDTFAVGRFPRPDQDYTWRITSTPRFNDLNLNDIRIDVSWPNGTYTLRTRAYAVDTTS